MNTGYIESVRSPLDAVADWREFEIPSEFSYRAILGPCADQGESFTCVGHSMKAVLDAMWNGHTGTGNGCPVTAQEIYDGRPDKTVNGMQPRDALRAHTGNRIAGGYARIGSPLQARLSLIMSGPLLVGLPVRGSSPSFWRGRRFSGGHCVACTGYSPSGLELRNSWGASWADGGYTLLPWDDWNLIMEAWCVTQ